jgi:broad specificity phosphatase PhoE
MASLTSRAPTTLLLCRHGQSEWNQQGLIQGQSPEAGGLTARGRWEAQQLGERLQALGVDALYTSDLLRAQQTAQIVGTALGLPARPDPRWREIDLGVWQGLTTEEVDQRWPPSLQIRELDLPRGEIGETFAAVSQRALAAISDLDTRHRGKTVAVVCHGGNVRAALLASKVTTTNGPDPRHVYIPNTSVTILQVNGAGLQATLFPDASHVDGHAPEMRMVNADEQR